MREYRGKRKDNGKWVYGYVVKKTYHDGYYIMTRAYSSDRVNTTGFVSGGWGGYEDVITETIGRDIGLKDKNGTRIFEGDIVFYAYEDEHGVLEWDKQSARYIVDFGTWCTDFDSLYEGDIEVVGNIHDNPELLEDRT